MKKLFTPFFLLFSDFVFCQAPTFQWETGFFGSVIYGHSVVTDPFNDVYTFGDFQGR